MVEVPVEKELDASRRNRFAINATTLLSFFAPDIK